MDAAEMIHQDPGRMIHADDLVQDHAEHFILCPGILQEMDFHEHYVIQTERRGCPAGHPVVSDSVHNSVINWNIEKIRFKIPDPSAADILFCFCRSRLNTDHNISEYSSILSLI